MSRQPTCFGPSANAVIVVDASAVIEILLSRSVGVRIRDRIFRAGEKINVPQLLDVEVLQVIRRYTLAGLMAGSRAEEAIARYREMEIERYSHELLFDRIWQLRFNVTAYDAAYVALAELLGTRLVTTDRRLAKAAPHVAELIQ